MSKDRVTVPSPLPPMGASQLSAGTQVPTMPPMSEFNPPPESKPDHPDHTAKLPVPPIASPPAAVTWELEASNNLLARGWEKLGVNERGVGIWSDPVGNVSQKGRLEPTVKLPTSDGGEETIRQMVCPPVSWNMTTENAMAIQKTRDQAIARFHAQQGGVNSGPPSPHVVGRNHLGQVIVSASSNETLDEVIARKEKELEQLKVVREEGKVA